MLLYLPDTIRLLSTPYQVALRDWTLPMSPTSFSCPIDHSLCLRPTPERLWNGACHQQRPASPSLVLWGVPLPNITQSLSVVLARGPGQPQEPGLGLQGCGCAAASPLGKAGRCAQVGGSYKPWLNSGSQSLNQRCAGKGKQWALREGSSAVTASEGFCGVNTPIMQISRYDIFFHGSQNS